MALTPLASNASSADYTSFAGSFTLQPPNFMTAPSKYVREFMMDQVLALQIFKFYNEEEPLIGICKAQRFALTFAGELRVEWGGGDIEPVRLDSPAEHDPLISLFKRVLEYRDMFGMVPVKLSKRTSRARSANKAMIGIPAFGSGVFVMKYDTKALASTVVYRVATAKAESKRASAAQSQPFSHTATATATAMVKDYPVYIWPGYEPSRATMRFRSHVASLLGAYATITELVDNMRHADYRAAHPVIFTQARPDTRNIQQMTEEEMLGMADDGPGTEEGRRYQRDVHRAIQTEAAAARTNQAARETGGGVLGAPVARAMLDPASRRLVAAERAQTWDGAIMPLPVGEEMAREVASHSRADIAAHVASYRDLVCKAMGVPEAYISGATGSQRMRGEADQLRANVRAAVLQDRTDVDLFFKWAYEMTHRATDNERLVTALLVTDDLESGELTPDERARVADVRKNIMRVVAMPYRTTVVFSEDPLPKKLDIPILAAAVGAGAVTKLEYINLIRVEMGLPSIDASHDLVRKVDSNAAAEPPATPTVSAAVGAGSGGEGSSVEKPAKESAEKPTKPAEEKKAETKPTKKKKDDKTTKTKNKKRKTPTADDDEADADADADADDTRKRDKGKGKGKDKNARPAKKKRADQ